MENFHESSVQNQDCPFEKSPVKVFKTRKKLEKHFFNLFNCLKTSYQEKSISGVLFINRGP